VLHDGTAVPMATVITGCGVLAVSLALVTRRAQLKRDALTQHVDVRL
jgi:DHA1 family bicyclomycin/chloramphenicol resistance-like MFS transporter